jgi:hypothetical protein
MKATPCMMQDAAAGAESAEQEAGTYIRRHGEGKSPTSMMKVCPPEAAVRRRDQRRNDDRRQRGDRIGADDQLEGIEGAGQRRVEGGGDGAGRAAADQHAQIAAAQFAACRPSREAMPAPTCV